MHINLTFSDNISNASRNCSSEGNGHCRTRVSRKELEDGWIECTREIVEISVLRGMHRILFRSNALPRANTFLAWHIQYAPGKDGCKKYRRSLRVSSHGLLEVENRGDTKTANKA